MRDKRPVRAAIAAAYFISMTGCVCFTMKGGGAGQSLKGIRLPEGFAISYFARDLPGARSLALGEKGTVFVGTRSEGKVYAVKDLDGDFSSDKTFYFY